MQVNFSHKICFPPDDIEENIEFEAYFSDTGFYYTIGNERGFKPETSLDEIILASPLEGEQLDYVQRLIDRGSFDNLAYQTLADNS
ncbi:MAG: hypothetical protein Q7R95_11265 [bacterium]|nr:hypothetical protein [bacterium]